MDTETMLLDYVKDELLHGGSPELTSKDNLLDSGKLDSLGILQLVTFIEERLGKEIPPEDVAYENFYAIDALANYLNGLD